MKKMSVAALEREYERLRKSLMKIGCISQGSVLDRSTLKTPRSGYQWTRKIAQKTITVALSPEQFASLKVAITLAFVGTVLAEMTAGDSGIGYLMQTAGSQQRMPLAFAGLVTIGAMAMAMYELFSWVEKRTTGWAHRGSQSA